MKLVVDIVKNGDAKLVLDSRTSSIKTVLEFKKRQPRGCLFLWRDEQKCPADTILFLLEKSVFLPAKQRQNSDPHQPLRRRCCDLTRGLFCSEVAVNRQREEHHVRCDHLDAEVHQLALTEDHVHHHKHGGDADEVGDENGFGHVDACLP